MGHCGIPERAMDRDPKDLSYAPNPATGHCVAFLKAVYLSGVQFLHLLIEVIIYDGSSGSYN